MSQISQYFDLCKVPYFGQYKLLTTLEKKINSFVTFPFHLSNIKVIWLELLLLIRCKPPIYNNFSAKTKNQEPNPDDPVTSHPNHGC